MRCEARDYESHRLDTYSGLLTIPPSLVSGRHIAIAEVPQTMLYGSAKLNTDAPTILNTPSTTVLAAPRSMKPRNTASIEPRNTASMAESSVETSNTASTRRIRNMYIFPKYCQYSKYSQYFPPEIFYLLSYTGTSVQIFQVVASVIFQQMFLPLVYFKRNEYRHL